MEENKEFNNKEIADIALLCIDIVGDIIDILIDDEKYNTKDSAYDAIRDIMLNKGLVETFE